MREHINNLRKETETTLRVLCALRQFRLFITKQETVNKINENPYFWLIYESSLRTNLFLGIRRLYESKSGTFNFQRFINLCIDNIDKFSKESLRSRKVSGSSNASEWIDEYMFDVYEPKEEDFKEFARVVRNNSKKMKGIYSDAASKIFAHAIHMDHASISNVMEQLNFGEMEIALTSIWHSYEQIWQMYENGKQPTFNVGTYPYQQEVIDSVIKQLG